MGILGAFWGCLKQSFPEGIIKPYEGTSLTIGKVCYVFSCFVSFSYTDERLILGLRRKDWILGALLLAAKSLWPHKVGSRGEIYSARWKLMLISDQAKDVFVKNCLLGGGSMSPFQPLVYIQDLE